MACDHRFIPVEVESRIKNAQGELVQTHGQPSAGWPNYTVVRKLMCEKCDLEKERKA